METIHLNHLNTTLKVSGSEKTRSLEIIDVSVQRAPAQGSDFRLIVFDEKDIPIYSQDLSSSDGEGNNRVEVNQKFAFYDHLTVQVTAGPSDSPFDVKLHINTN